jgi:hypothetical protein
MKMPKTLLAIAAGLSLIAASAPAATTDKGPPLGMPAGTYNWYDQPENGTLVGYMIVECSGMIRGPYPGPGGQYAEITIYEEFIPQPC